MTTATLGIDLSSQPASTAVCVVAWASGRATVRALWRGADPAGAPLTDATLVALMRGEVDGLPTPAKVAIDAPLGWPVDFVRAVGDPGRWPVAIDAPRGRLERRATDAWIHAQTGKLPLSVSTDRIAYPAMRAAGLLAHYERVTGEPVDRAGGVGRVCEAYPDPSIRRLGLWPPDVGPRASYKGAAHAVRAAIVARLGELAPWLALAEADRRGCVELDDCLDALICALAARAAQLGLTADPPAELAQEAATEGWIRLPEPGSLARLV